MPYVKVSQESPALTNAVTDVWQTIISELRDTKQRARSGDGHTNQSEQLAALGDKDFSKRMPPMHRKTWKALITDKQVE
jgi:hypothetical protein